jgi:hypothetical protein
MMTDVQLAGLEAAVAAATRSEASIAWFDHKAPPHVVANMTTKQLEIVWGELEDGTAWRLFAKTLQPAWASPLFDFVPEEHRQNALANLDWESEPRVFACGLADDLPSGFRLPTLWHLEESGDAKTLWMENIDDHSSWDLARYRQVAELLGRAAALWPEERVQRELGLGRRAIDGLFFGKIVNFDLVQLQDESLWADPDVASVGADLREPIFRAAEQMPALLARLKGLPHGLAHGDSAPSNFLDPADGSVVAIDWSYGASGPLGSDLSQLVSGHPAIGRPLPVPIGDLVPQLVDAFVAGYRADGGEVDTADVELAMATHLCIRLAFTALIPGPDVHTAVSRRDLLTSRAQIARQALRMVGLL